MKNKINRRKS